jgi:hypothetical protein
MSQRAARLERFRLSRELALQATRQAKETQTEPEAPDVLRGLNENDLKRAYGETEEQYLRRIETLVQRRQQELEWAAEAEEHKRRINTFRPRTDDTLRYVLRNRELIYPSQQSRVFPYAKDVLPSKEYAYHLRETLMADGKGRKFMEFLEGNRKRMIDQSYACGNILP